MPTQNVLPLCCPRIYLADPVRAESPEAWRELPACTPAHIVLRPQAVPSPDPPTATSPGTRVARLLQARQPYGCLFVPLLHAAVGRLHPQSDQQWASHATPDTWTRSLQALRSAGPMPSHSLTHVMHALQHVAFGEGRLVPVQEAQLLLSLATAANRRLCTVLGMLASKMHCDLQDQVSGTTRHDTPPKLMKMAMEAVTGLSTDASHKEPAQCRLQFLVDGSRRQGNMKQTCDACVLCICEDEKDPKDTEGTEESSSSPTERPQVQSNLSALAKEFKPRPQQS